MLKKIFSVTLLSLILALQCLNLSAMEYGPHNKKREKKTSSNCKIASNEQTIQNIRNNISNLETIEEVDFNIQVLKILKKDGLYKKLKAQANKAIKELQIKRIQLQQAETQKQLDFLSESIALLKSPIAGFNEEYNPDERALLEELNEILFSASQINSCEISTPNYDVNYEDNYNFELDDNYNYEDNNNFEEWLERSDSTHETKLEAMIEDINLNSEADQLDTNILEAANLNLTEKDTPINLESTIILQDKSFKEMQNIKEAQASVEKAQAMLKEALDKLNDTNAVAHDIFLKLKEKLEQKTADLKNKIEEIDAQDTTLGVILKIETENKLHDVEVNADQVNKMLKETETDITQDSTSSGTSCIIL